MARRVHGFPSLLTWGVASVGGLYVFEAIAAESLPLRPGINAADVIDLAATAVIIFMTALVVRRRRGGLSIGDLLDGLIITGGAWLVSWIVFVEPFVNSSSDATPELIVNALYLPTAMPLIALAALLVFGTGRPTSTVLLIAIGLLLNVFGDLIYALDATRSTRRLGVHARGHLLPLLRGHVCGGVLPSERPRPCWVSRRYRVTTPCPAASR